MTLRGLIQPDAGWLERPGAREAAWVAAAALGGMALYGFTVGFWRDPLMGVFVAVKLPLLIVLTLLCNALLNGMLGILLGTGLGFRQSFHALLTSFAVAAVILGSLSPVTFLLAWNAPPPDSPGARTAHAAYLASHTAWIAFAGVAANLHLHRMLAGRSPSRRAATVTLLAWLGGNAFLGAQFSWILRPFFGSPGLKVEFLRPRPFDGTFHEAVWRALNMITGGHALAALALVSLPILIPVLRTLVPKPHPKRKP